MANRWIKVTPTQRFWAKVDPCRTDGCWLWLGSKDRQGYGWFSVEEHGITRAHHFLNGKPTPPLVYDHLCRQPSCVNPEHLEVVSVKENTLRGQSLAALEAKRTHCPRGHEYTADNIYWEYRKGKTSRHCRICLRETSRKTMRRRREKLISVA